MRYYSQTKKVWEQKIYRKKHNQKKRKPKANGKAFLSHKDTYSSTPNGIKRKDYIDYKTTK